MSEWHITPDYILNNWTDEQLELYVVKLVERKTRATQPESSHGNSGGHKVSDSVLFAKAKNLIKVRKK